MKSITQHQSKSNCPSKLFKSEKKSPDSFLHNFQAYVFNIESNKAPDMEGKTLTVGSEFLGKNAWGADSSIQVKLKQSVGLLGN